MKIFDVPIEILTDELYTEHLAVLDNGYFDALVAIGYAALADSYYEGQSPNIEKTASGFRVTHSIHQRERPNLSWLKYSIAGSWAGKKEVAEDNMTFKDKNWNTETVIYHEGAYLNVGKDSYMIIEISDKSYNIPSPLRELFGVINKLGSPKWWNTHIYSCRHKGLELLQNTYESRASFNSIILPQTSKGAMSGNSFSIGNGSVSSNISKKWSREISLAVAGLLASARGSTSEGFAIPVPGKIEFAFFKQLVQRNRIRMMPKDFFFPYDNYLYYIKSLLTYGQKGKQFLSSVSGARFIELGTQSSPAGAWSLTIPSYDITISDVENLRQILRTWRRAVKKSGSEPNINRAAVERFIRGFEKADIPNFIEGYLSYLIDVGLNSTNQIKLLNENQIIKIMEANKRKYSKLSEEMLSEDVMAMITLIRQNTVYRLNKDSSKGPDYGLIKKLRDVQNHNDLILALSDISITRAVDIMATSKSDTTTETHGNVSDEKSYSLKRPVQKGITKLIELSEDPDYSPKLVANLLLALALSK